MTLKKKIEELQDVNELEKMKLRIEHYKARSTIISIIASLLAVVITIIVNMFLEARRSETNFELKAVEIVMTAENPKKAVNKAIVLQELFPNRLSSHFSDTLKKLYSDDDESMRR